REDAAVAQIGVTGWSVAPLTLMSFWRSPGFGEIARPEPGGDIEALRRLLHLGDREWLLVLAFLLSSLRPRGPYLCLLIEGEQGSGKSVLCSIIKRVIDPHQLEKFRLPTTDRDLMIQAKDHYLLVFDNVSGMRGDISDALCALATGGGFGTRKLYTDDELQVFNFCRPFIINGIADFATRPDLVERAIILQLPTMP